MLQEEIIEFAKLLVQNVRDSAIRNCDVQLNTANLNSPIAKRWQAAKNNTDGEPLGEMIIADCVDETIFCLLQAIDQGLLNISFNSSNNKTINLSREGLSEISGWYMGEWRSKYSSQRCYNDCE